MTLPIGLEAPTSMTATSSTPHYDPVHRQVTWTGTVTPGAAEVVAFTSPISAGLTTCGQLTVTGQVRDGLAAVTPLQASVQVAVPDVTCDGRVDIADISEVTTRWGAVPGDGRYHPRYDLDGDDAIGVLDIIAVATRWQ